ncbi:GDSL-type esterase/lipase family protein [Hymenobacter lucidus]|uniref:GDSL-type esterase/lipase family protein n=1 Tax=Hymenobacter lucidus TaxID=2880930 RepID=A0ABS8AU67_9BACT|nr:GDSL-type esterase/lipase family protein [Hymenobacter lucidus]MCB2409765.1 GDSL-type esterase/lipase family protein [Hymenobacter lucidus]
MTILLKLPLPCLLLAAALLAPLAATAQQPKPAAYDWAWQERYAAANQKLPAPPASPARVVIIGNSITEGWVKTDSAFFAGKPYGYIGRGISGQHTGQTLLRFRQDVINLRPAVVVIVVGTNDVAENGGPYMPERTMENIMSMAELARAHRIRVVLASVLPATDFWWRKGLNPAPKIVALNQQLKAYAAQQRHTYLDFHSAMADEQQGLQKIYGEDGVHPNLAGYRVMEPLLNQAVAQALKQKQP